MWYVVRVPLRVPLTVITMSLSRHLTWLRIAVLSSLQWLSYVYGDHLWPMLSASTLNTSPRISCLFRLLRLRVTTPFVPRTHNTAFLYSYSIFSNFLFMLFRWPASVVYWNHVCQTSQTKKLASASSPNASMLARDLECTDIFQLLSLK